MMRIVTPNRKAFLDMIAASEGTKGKGDDGYNVLVGGGLFTGYADHPRVVVGPPKIPVKSTAAGRYQILARYYDYYKVLLELTDFSPKSQDAIALQIIYERRALPEVDSGDVLQAIHQCRTIWASFPGSGYEQHEQDLTYLVRAYIDSGGQANV